MKKLLLSLGAMTAVVAPVAAVVACGDTKDTKTTSTGTVKGGMSVPDQTFVTKLTLLNTKLSGVSSLQDAKDAIDGYNELDEAQRTMAAFYKDAADVKSPLAGKAIKAELFFQQDNKGAATYVGSSTTAHELSQLHALATTGLVDVTEAGHKINGLGKLGVRLVLNSEAAPAPKTLVDHAFAGYATLANFITQLTDSAKKAA